MLLVALPVGSIMAIKGSEYWNQVWIGFDKFANSIIGGSHEETISSRLGKSTAYGLNPVFFNIWIDGLISWWLHQVDKDHVEKYIDWSVGEQRK